MSLSAVSLGLALLVGGNAQTGRLTGREQDIWQSMAPAIVTLLEGDKPVAAAALIDDEGLFVAAKNAIPASGDVRARLSNGQVIHLNVVARNGVTGLALLEAEGWSNPDVHAFRPPLEKEQKGARLFAILANGPIRAEFVSDQLTGVRTKSRIMVPLSEIRFEAPAELIGSALIVCENGEFLGALNATLQNRQDQNNYQGMQQALGSNGSPLKGVLGGNGGFQRLQQNNIGPSSMTIAYTVGQDMVRQVLEGFRSPNHQVAFPSIGVFCQDANGAGAIIQKITPDSPAEHVGLRVGDIIQEVGDTSIRDQITFGKVMLKQRIGTRIPIKVLRAGSLIVPLEVTVGKALDRD